MARLAWFSPMPPVRSGVADYSAELVDALRDHHQLDVFVDEPVARANPGALSAHEFLWKHVRAPYDLTVHQLGNSSHHDYQWPYLFRYPGLTVLHDLNLHHARAASLLRTGRARDYRTEFRANEPHASADSAELAVRGFDTHLYYWWPLTRLAAKTSRLVAVHSDAQRQLLDGEIEGLRIEAVRLGHGVGLTEADQAAARARGRARHGLPEDAVVFGCFGGLAPEKRIPQILAAFAAVEPYMSGARLLLAGAAASHYDLAADVRRHHLEERVVSTGYLDTNALTDAIAASDVALNLRWPTAREISGPWLRALAIGRATVIVDLEHLADIPSLDPRTWQLNHGGSRSSRAVCVAVDILDEDHSLRLAMRRLASDAALRHQLGEAARVYWNDRHTVEGMAEDYRRVLDLALTIERPHPVVPADLPAHLASDGMEQLDEVLRGLGLTSPLR